MTKPSSMVIRSVAPLDQLPQHEVEVIRRFLFQHIRGVGDISDKRWRRLWGAIWRADPDEAHVLFHAEERSGPFHRMHQAVLGRLFELQERFTNIDRLHDWLKVGAGFVEWQEGRRGGLWPKPRSTNFKDCSEAEIREFHHDMVEFLHTERAQRFLWRRVKADQREAMLAVALKKTEDEHDGH